MYVAYLFGQTIAIISMEYELSTTASSKRKSATMVEVNSNRGSKHLDQDAIALQRIGKKSVLKVRNML